MKYSKENNLMPIKFRGAISAETKLNAAVRKKRIKVINQEFFAFTYLVED